MEDGKLTVRAALDEDTSVLVGQRAMTAPIEDGEVYVVRNVSKCASLTPVTHAPYEEMGLGPLVITFLVLAVLRRHEGGCVLADLQRQQRARFAWHTWQQSCAACLLSSPHPRPSYCGWEDPRSSRARMICESTFRDAAVTEASSCERRQKKA